MRRIEYYRNICLEMLGSISTYMLNVDLLLADFRILFECSARLVEVSNYAPKLAQKIELIKSYLDMG
jgi:hypothetical protein